MIPVRKGFFADCLNAFGNADNFLVVPKRKENQPFIFLMDQCSLPEGKNRMSFRDDEFVQGSTAGKSITADFIQLGGQLNGLTRFTGRKSIVTYGNQ